MSLPDNYKPKEGDVLILHATVKHSFTGGDGAIYLEVGGHYSTLCLEASEIAGVHQLVFEPGQRVFADEDCGHIIAAHEGMAWVEFDNHKTAVVRVSDLERVEEPANESEAAATEPEAQAQA